MMMYLNNNNHHTSSSAPGSFSDISTSISAAHNAMDMETRNNEMMFIPPTGGPMCMQQQQQGISAQLSDTVTGDPSGMTQQNVIDGGEHNLQSLSLSLSTQMSNNTIPASSFSHHYQNQGFASLLTSQLPGSCRSVIGAKVSDEVSQSKDLMNSDFGSYHMQGGAGDDQNVIRFGSAVKNLQYGMDPKGGFGANNFYSYEQQAAGSMLSNSIMKSKYLKATQQLLDEVVNVKDALKVSDTVKEQSENKGEEGSKESKSMISSDVQESGTGGGSAHEISAAERQELQNKLDKLLSMLEEVDRRYKQYYHQMQVLVSSFDMVAGNGAAKPYTSLALKTISRHFRCLRDAISNQIQVTRKSLGEQDTGQGGLIPRLRYVDQQLRQQRALQQFGMMRHAWRPQRGLPESAVTILRAWLFEHFLHPYPKDSEKTMLARQTGLTRSQVANWFINARVRLWKPMVEEMYKEEFGDADINIKSPPETRDPGERSLASEDRRDELQGSVSSMAADDGSFGHHHHDLKNNITHEVEMSEPQARTGLQQITAGHGHDNKSYGFMRIPTDQQQQQQHNLVVSHGLYPSHNVPADHNGEGGLMVANAAYQVSELDHFGLDNQVSLALGLRHREGDVGAGTSFRDNAPTAPTNVAAGTVEYSYLEQVNQQHRFGNSHLLNDFVS